MRLRVRSTISQVAQQKRERHFPIPVLEAVLHCGLDLALDLRLSYASMKSAESRRKSSAGAIASTQSLTTTWPAAGKLAIR
jgi:hypothetical protein